MTTMKKSIHDNANGLDYTLVNDHYLPKWNGMCSHRIGSDTGRIGSPNRNRSVCCPGGERHPGFCTTSGVRNLHRRSDRTADASRYHSGVFSENASAASALHPRPPA